MLVKLAITGTVALVAFAGVLFAVNRTANRKEEENAALPLSEQLSAEELESLLLSSFIQDVKTATPVKVISLILEDVKRFFLTMYSYRVKAASVVIALSVFPSMGFSVASLKAAYSVLGQELLFQAVYHVHTLRALKRAKEEDYSEPGSIS